MDNPDNNRFSASEDFDKPIPLDNDLDKAILFDDDTSQTKVSHSPLTLGGGREASVAKPVTETHIAEKSGEEKVSTGRITGVKTFFTKLHAGAMEFLDEQIKKWLQENPGVHIKLTNTTTGEVQGKKTEPNIIITVWY